MEAIICNDIAQLKLAVLRVNSWFYITLTGRLRRI